MKKQMKVMPLWCLLGMAVMINSVAWAQSVDEAFSQCVQHTLKNKAQSENISEAVIERDLMAVQFVARVIELDRKQPEFSETFYGYYTKRVTEQRIRIGRERMQQYQPLLQQLTKQYGVPAQYIMAFWGLETNFGSYLGKMPVLDSLATLACDPRRADFFTGELMEALKLVDAGVVTADAMQGSWAGAMGNMQFMPSAYRRFALDADNDNKADLWNSVPDALTSAAHFLQQLGWQSELRWGREVVLPQGFDYSLTGRSTTKPLSQWRGLGVRDVWQNSLPNLPLESSIIIPSGHRGPAFVIYDNFEVILRWNRSEYYALAVGILADQIKNGLPLRVAPPASQPLTIALVKDFQQMLNNAGFDAGKVDGVLGSKTKRAWQLFQKENKLVADGYVDAEVIKQWLEKAPSAQPIEKQQRDFGAVKLQGHFVQGGLVLGKAEKGAQIFWQKKPIKISRDGDFILGFGRDEKNGQPLTIIAADGTEKTVQLQIRQRQYNVQRVEGVPTQTVNPDQKHLARIGEEAAAVKQARNADSDLAIFLQSFQWPLKGPVTGVYGSQRVYNGEPRRPHFGVDIAADHGSHIIAPADGVVSLAHPDMFFSGATMIIDHGFGVSTSYLHMSQMLVKNGDAVKQGQVIGKVGASGRATGPHLCWRLNWYQTKLDPQLLVPDL